MSKETNIGQGLGGSPSRLLEFGEGWDSYVLTINMVGIVSAEAFGRPKIVRKIITKYIEGGLVYRMPLRPIEVRLRGIESAEFFGRPEIGLNLNIHNIWSIEKFGQLKVAKDRRFVSKDELEEEEALNFFLMAA